MRDSKYNRDDKEEILCTGEICHHTAVVKNSNYGDDGGGRKRETCSDDDTDRSQCRRL